MFMLSVTLKLLDKSGQVVNDKQIQKSGFC